ncbi:hypothetical protein FKM82_028057 [Ascaphus truei]
MKVRYILGKNEYRVWTESEGQTSSGETPLASGESSLQHCKQLMGSALDHSVCTKTLSQHIHTSLPEESLLIAHRYTRQRQGCTT